MRTPSRETDSHYHLNADCIRAVEKAFDPHHICVPEDLTLDNIHKEKIKAEFHVNFIEVIFAICIAFCIAQL